MPDRTTLVAGGLTGEGTATDSIVIHDPLTNASTAVGQLLAPRVDAAATRLDDGRVLITGGQVGSLISSDVEIFDPATGESTFAALLQQPRTGHASALLADGTVLIVGGTTVDGVVVATTERFDPSTHSVTATEPMAVARTGASATTLIDGRVLVAGGHDGAQDLASAEIYSPFDDTFLPVETAMSVARAGHAAVLLPHNNSVLIAGGTNAGTAVTTTDLFLPAMFPDPYSWGMGTFGPTDPEELARMTMVQPRSLAVAGPWGDDGYAFAMGGGSGDGEVYRFATIKTDKDDYAPGELAVITGSGWAASRGSDADVPGGPRGTRRLRADAHRRRRGEHLSQRMGARGARPGRAVLSDGDRVAVARADNVYGRNHTSQGNLYPNRTRQCAHKLGTL